MHFDSVAIDTNRLDTLAHRDSLATVAAPGDTTAPKGFIISFAAFLTEDRARELASHIQVAGEAARVVTTTRDGSPIYRVILGPYVTREEAERAGKESGHSYWVYEGLP